MAVFFFSEVTGGFEQVNTGLFLYTWRVNVFSFTLPWVAWILVQVDTGMFPYTWTITVFCFTQDGLSSCTGRCRHVSSHPEQQMCSVLPKVARVFAQVDLDMTLYTQDNAVFFFLPWIVWVLAQMHMCFETCDQYLKFSFSLGCLGSHGHIQVSTPDQ